MSKRAGKVFLKARSPAEPESGELKKASASRQRS